MERSYFNIQSELSMNFNKYFCNEEIIYTMGTSMILNSIEFNGMEPRISGLVLNPFKDIILYLYGGSNYYYISKEEQGIWYDIVEHRALRHRVNLL